MAILPGAFLFDVERLDVGLPFRHARIAFFCPAFLYASISLATIEGRDQPPTARTKCLAFPRCIFVRRGADARCSRDNTLPPRFSAGYFRSRKRARSRTILATSRKTCSLVILTSPSGHSVVVLFSPTHVSGVASRIANNSGLQAVVYLEIYRYSALSNVHHVRTEMRGFNPQKR